MEAREPTSASAAPAVGKGLGSHRATGAWRNHTTARRNGWSATDARILHECAVAARNGGGSAVHVDSTASGRRFTIEFKHCKEHVSPLVEASLALRLQAVAVQQQSQQAWIDRKAACTSPPKERRRTRKRRQLKKKQESDTAEQLVAMEASAASSGTAQQETADEMAVDDDARPGGTVPPATATTDREVITPSQTREERPPALAPSLVPPSAPSRAGQKSEFRLTMTSGWQERQECVGGRLFYYHTATNRSTWTKPEGLRYVKVRAGATPPR